MWVRPLTVVLTVLFVNLGWAVFQHDGYAGFIPLVASFNSGQVVAYDFFLVIAVLLLRLVVSRLGVSLSTVRNAVLMFFDKYDLVETILIAIAGMVTQFFLVPLVLAVLADPIGAVNQSHDGIRRVIVIVLPVLWMIAVSLVLKGGGRRMFRSSPPVQSQGTNLPVMPQSPQWP